MNARYGLFLAFLFLPVVWAQQIDQTAPRPVAMPLRVTEAPTIDGVLNEDVWQEAMLLTGFVQADPFEGEPASEETEVRILL